MKQICRYDPVRDKGAVVPDMSVDLSEAIATHVVLDTGEDPFFNDIDDPSNITGRVRDAFEAIDMQRKYGKQYAESVAAAKAAAAAKTGEPDTGAQG